MGIRQQYLIEARCQKQAGGSSHLKWKKLGHLSEVFVVVIIQCKQEPSPLQAHSWDPPESCGNLLTSGQFPYLSEEHRDDLQNWQNKTLLITKTVKTTNWYFVNVISRYSNCITQSLHLWITFKVRLLNYTRNTSLCSAPRNLQLANT